MDPSDLISSCRLQCTNAPISMTKNEVNVASYLLTNLDRMTENFFRPRKILLAYIVIQWIQANIKSFHASWISYIVQAGIRHPQVRMVLDVCWFEKRTHNGTFLSTTGG